MGKGEIACYEQFLLFPQCFQKACFSVASKGVIVWEWVKSRDFVREGLDLIVAYLLLPYRHLTPPTLIKENKQLENNYMITNVLRIKENKMEKITYLLPNGNHWIKIELYRKIFIVKPAYGELDIHSCHNPHLSVYFPGSVCASVCLSEFVWTITSTIVDGFLNNMTQLSSII